MARVEPLPSIGRITGLGLVIAAATILVLAILVIYDVQRETELNRDLIGAQQVKDGLESLRVRLHELKFAAREHGFTGRPGALQAIERSAVEVEADLAYLVERAGVDDSLGPFAGELREAVAGHAAYLRDAARGAAARAHTDPDLPQAVALERRARVALERALDAQTQRINDRATAQIRVGENLNFYVLLLIAGAIAVLAGLFAVFQHAQSRNREAQRRMEFLAHFDPVTRLPNRSLLSDRLAQEVARAQRGTREFAVALFDLDGFKAVNDTFGHASGDALLAQVAERARSSVRVSDTVGRQGGDEFLVILPETTREGAVQVAEKLRVSLAEPYDLAAGRRVTLSASVGISLFPHHGSDPDALYRAADTALYDAKRLGKNRTAVARD